MSGIGFFGGDAYVLSTTTIESPELMGQFPGYDDSFRILDPVAFAAAIASAIPHFHLGCQGPCVYKGERRVERQLADPLFTEPPKTQEEGERFFHETNRRIFEAAAFDPFFAKPKKFSQQAEYRLVWCTAHSLQNDTLTITCPDARQFCERA